MLKIYGDKQSGNCYKINLQGYPHVLAWIDRIKQHPLYVGKPT